MKKAKKKPTKKAKPTKAWGIVKRSGILEDKTYSRRFQASDDCMRDEKVVRVEIRQIN